MAEKASDGLPYGQLGAAVYDQDHSEWGFARASGSIVQSRPLGASITIAKPTSEANGFHSWSKGKGGQSRRREIQTKALTRSIPDLQPAAHLLPELVRASEAVEEAVSKHDSSFDERIALGEMYDESKRDYVDAVAFPCGPTGSDVRIVQGLRQRQGWEENKTSWIETLNFVGEEATWQGPGAPVLSIIFAQPLESGERYLAVRLQTETLIFRPVLRRQVTARHTRLDPNFLFSVSIEITGGFLHAHAAFNPWFTGQLAIIDHAKSWSVWETGRKSRNAKQIKSGTMSNEVPRKAERALDDGWARVTWIESTSTICIATRRELRLVDLEATGDYAPVIVNVGLYKGFGLILDVGTLRSSLEHLFVLTSDHILMYGISRKSDKQINPMLLSQIRHHRSPEDISLRMTVGVSKNYVLLILRSAFSAAVDNFTFDMSDPDQIRTMQPQSFELPPDLAASNVANCHLEAVPFIENDGVTLESPKPSKFWQLYLLRKDLALLQALYVSTARLHQDIVAPTWTKKISKLPKNSRTQLLGLQDNGQTASCGPAVSNYVQRRQRQTLSRTGDDWTISYERLARVLNTKRMDDTTDIDKVIDKITSLLREPCAGLPKPLRSLWEVAGDYVALEDTRGVYERLAGLHLLEEQKSAVKKEYGEPSQDTQIERLAVSSIASPPAFNTLGLDALDTLSSAANALGQDWIASSGSLFAAETSIARNDHARCMAADIVLASQVIRTVSDETDNANAIESQSQVWDLPVRPTPLEDVFQKPKATGYGSQRLQFPALPTPSASASTVTGSSYPLGSSAPEIARLSKYTTFSKDAPAPLPRALNKVIAHWDVDTDPSEYDWRDATRQVTRRDEEAEEDDMTERERRQIQRRTERYMRRQRREAEESQWMQMLSSQAPEILSASQPAQRQRLRRAESQASAGAAVGSGQSYGLSQMAASQVVPGRHGGRPPARKKRKSGF